MNGTDTPHDAILLVGFGGPEHREDVIPFLENVLRGRNVPRERMLAVAEHYYHFDGVSPINQQVRDLLAVLRPELERIGIDLPIYWGNRNWHPMLAETLAEMTAAGVRKALAVVLAAYSSYSSCRQYREDLGQAREAAGPEAPTVDKVRVFFNHPRFVAANADRVSTGLDRFPADRRSEVRVAFTAHSIPASMASACDYEAQLWESSRLVAEAVGIGADQWSLVYQSRSGRPTDPWLEPDILDHLANLHRQGIDDVLIHPIGFLSDHMEVLYDLDDEARGVAEDLELSMVRSASVGTHPEFVTMLGELIRERLEPGQERRSIGMFGPRVDVCPADCCPAPARPRPAG